MRFWELRPEFRNPYAPVTVQNALGVEFNCPQCAADGLPEHRIWIPFRGDRGWKRSPHSTTMYDLTFEPSVRVISGRCFGHWNITAGEVIFHQDSRRGHPHHHHHPVKIRLPTHLHLEHHHHHHHGR